MSAQPVQADHLTAATIAAGRPRGKWGSRLATVLAAYNLANQGHQLWKNYRAERSFQVFVHEGDEVYDHVHDWLLGKLPPEAQRALTATTRTFRGDQPHKLDGSAPLDVSGDDTLVHRRVVFTYNGVRTHRVDLDGHTVEVRVEVDETSHRPGRDGDGRQSFLVLPKRVVFTASDVAGRQAVADFLQEIAATLVTGKRVPRLVVAGRWGSWGRRRPLPVRPLDTVVLPEGDLHALVDDLERFLAAETRYETLGQPWHRGYLLHGPPGTGKTSAFRAVAGHFGLDVYAVSLSDLETDAKLNELLGEIPERCMLLLEDIDVVHAAKTRDDAERPGVTLAGLLNALDGMITPHGMVTAMTTNHREVLDEALLRDGRVDYELELTYLTADQFEQLVQHLTGRAVKVSVTGDLWPQLVAGEVVGAVFRHLDDPTVAVQAAADLMIDRWTFWAGTSNGADAPELVVLDGGTLR